MIRIKKDAVLTTEIIKKLIEQHQSTVVPRLVKLENYYQGRTDILQRQMADITKPNNKIVNPFANYITDMFVGYFMGEPVAYKSNDKEALEELQLIFNYNDEQDENAELAHNASIYGVAYEMCYVDADGMVRFRQINPKEVICVYDNTVENDLLYAIRYYQDTDILTDKVSIVVEVYSRNDIKTYKCSELLGDFVLIDEEPHFFGLVPFAEYKNNSDEIGDFELVISLIDAYDKLISDSLNDFEYFCDAYLGLYGMTADEEDIRMMKENRVILMDEGAKAEWITKNVNDTQMENLKTRLEKDIHKFSKCPNLSDENFVGNSSGVAMAYKNMGTENITSVKERKFKKGLQRRIELIAAINALKSSSFDWRAIEIVFTRNLPVNVAEIVDIANKLKGVVSNETIISQLPFVEDVQLELEKLANEKEANPFYSEMNPIVDAALGQEEIEEDV